MRSRPVSRRVALSYLACLPIGSAIAATPGGKEPVYLSAYRDNAGNFGIAVVGLDGGLSLKIRLPARGHGALARPHSSQAVVVARRPGMFALIFDRIHGGTVKTIQAAEGRHFFGHGVFSPDGRLFYATENDFEGERGIIGIYDASAEYRRLGEWDSYGIGPHELILLPDGVTLAVANGGILTHPDLPRLKLNLASMEPSITFIDRRSGEVVGVLRAPRELHQLSLRHLAARADGTIAIAAQWEGPETETPPLVGVGAMNGSLRLVNAPQPTQIAMKHYCGSVAFNGSGTHFAVTSPRGDTVTYWHADGRFDRAETLADGGGVAPHRAGFARSSGLGVLADASDRSVQTDLAWDNHLTMADSLS
ncbi:MAG: DUF1513 domain-containing protein [Pseudomonadota bacterium]